MVIINQNCHFLSLRAWSVIATHPSSGGGGTGLPGTIIDEYGGLLEARTYQEDQSTGNWADSTNTTLQNKDLQSFLQKMLLLETSGQTYSGKNLHSL